MKKILVATMLAVIAGTVLVTSATEAHAVQSAREASATLIHEFADWLSGQPSNSNVLVLSITNSTSTSPGQLNISQLDEKITIHHEGLSQIQDPNHDWTTLATTTLPSGESGHLELSFVPNSCSGHCLDLNPGGSPPATEVLSFSW
jgi:hypothetical protein